MLGICLQALQQRCRRIVPFCGGSSADDWRLEANHVFYNDSVHEDGMIDVHTVTINWGDGTIETLPAPAITRTGPSVVVTALYWDSLSSCR